MVLPSFVLAWEVQSALCHRSFSHYKATLQGLGKVYTTEVYLTDRPLGFKGLLLSLLTP